MDTFNSDINVFAKNSYRLKIHNFLFNHSSKKFSDLARAIVPSISRSREINNLNLEIVDSFVFNLLPKVLESDLDQIKYHSKLVAERIIFNSRKSTFIIYFSRFVIYYLKNIPLINLFFSLKNMDHLFLLIKQVILILLKI